jgi:hypothetical protein
MMPQNMFNYSYPGFSQGFGSLGGSQANPWSWSGQQNQQGGQFNPQALSSWQSPETSQGMGGMGGGSGIDWGSFFGGLFGGGGGSGGGLFGGGTGYQTGPYPYTGFGPQPPSNFTNPAARGPTPSTTPIQGGPATNYNPTTPQITANPVTDPSLAGFQAWGQSGGAPNLINPVTASFLGYGAAPPGASGYNPNTGQWE